MEAESDLLGITVSPGSSSFIHDPAYLASQDELRTLLMSAAQSPDSTRNNSPAPSNSDGLIRVRAAIESQAQDLLTRGHNLKYFNQYISQIAPWLDMFDSNRAFGIRIPAMQSRSLALVYSTLAIAARQLELKTAQRITSDSLELYQEAIQALKPLLDNRDEDSVAVCVILCCMEMMSESGRNWRRHLDGCAALFSSFEINGFSEELPRALFWCYARMDLCGALMSNGTESTLIPPPRWLPRQTSEQNAREAFRRVRTPDMHANYAVYLCAKTCELLSDRTRFVELGERNGCSDTSFAARWTALWLELGGWLADRPKELLPVHDTNAEPFPRIFFTHWAAISSNQLHHTACVLLLEMAPPDAFGACETNTSIVPYARRICGISLTNPHQGCLNNAIQPLWIAGRHLTHRSEHRELIKIFKDIQRSTGWITKWRISDLSSTWGYDVDTL